jgi:hypothetical protein
MHLEAAEIDRARHHDMLNRIARLRIAERRIFSWEEAHGFAAFQFGPEKLR